MVRVKDAKDWLLTWSPEEGVKTVPEKIQEFLEGSDVRRYIAVCEFSGKHHIHVAFSTEVSYNSDYKWWKKIFEKAGFKEPALDIKYHNNLIVCAGGYMQGQVLGRKGFTDEQLEFGREQYMLRQVRQRIRTFTDDIRIIPRAKFTATIGGIMAEADCDEKSAIRLARDMGFSFENDKTGHEQYRDIYAKRAKLS